MQRYNDKTPTLLSVSAFIIYTIVLVIAYALQIAIHVYYRTFYPDVEDN